MSRIERWWIPAPMRTDPEALRRARLAVWCPHVVAAAHAVFGLLYMTAVPAPDGIVLGAVAFAGLPACAYALASLRRLGSPSRTIGLVVGGAGTQLAALSALMGGALAPTLPWLALAPVILLLGGARGAGLAALVACTLVFAALLLVPPGVLPAPGPYVSALWFPCTFGLLIATASIFLLYERTRSRAVRRLRISHLWLARAQDEASAANHSKSAFLGRMSHEIRTPLMAIQGFADVLSEELRERLAHADHTAERQTLATLRRNGAHLLHVVDDLLDLSRIEAEALEFERSPQDLRRLLDDVLSVFRVSARQRGLALELEVEPDLPIELETDATRLRQILVNLVGNAVKFTEHGSVSLRARTIQEGSDMRIAISVSDTGIGMRADQLQRLFRPYHQGSLETARIFGGSGLGLTITKRLIEAMGGTIRVESRAGIGTTVTIEHPVYETRPVRVVDPATGEMAALPRRPLRDRHLLVVDDFHDNRVLLARLLSSAGATVELADSGLGALERVDAAEREGRPFDLILMDVQMPGMDGIEATAALRARGCTSSIVALTADAVSTTRERCLRAGFDEHATKPITRARLIDLVRRVAARPLWPTPIVEAMDPSSAGTGIAGAQSPWERLVERVLPPALRRDRDHVRRAGMALGFSLVPLPFLVLASWLLPRLFPGGTGLLLTGLLLLVVPLSIAMLAVLRLTGSLAVAGHINLAYASVPVGAMIGVSGGTQSCLAPWLVIFPIWALPIVGRRAAFVWTGLALGGFSLLLGLELWGWRAVQHMAPAQIPLTHALSSAALGIMLFVMGIVYERSKAASIDRLALLNVELERARDLANAAREAKSRFLATVSHEMQTPLTAILDQCVVLRSAWSESPPDLPDAMKVLQNIERNGTQLLQVLDDVLDLSRIEAGKLELERMAAWPAQLIREALGPARAHAQSRGVPLRVEIDSALPKAIVSDPTRLRQLLTKLIEGAVDAAGKPGLVFRAYGEWSSDAVVLVFSVEPEPGAELPDDWLGCWRGPDPSGGRLSFLLARALCQVMGGRIELRHEPGAGTAIDLCIPVVVMDARASASAALEPDVPATEGSAGDASIAGFRILLAEDSPDSQRLIAHMLRQAGADVVVARDGQGAVAAVRAAQPEGGFDVILMDMHMPVLDGAQATHMLRESGYAGAIVGLTAQSADEAREGCLAVGCDDFALKPIGRQTLIATLAAVVERTA